MTRSNLAHRLNNPQFDPSRFWSKARVLADPDKCWEWQGVVTRDGYGCFHYRGYTPQYLRAHRIAWALAKKQVPTLHILHSCDNPPCINPNHLRQGTDKDNTQDAIDRGRFPSHHWLVVGTAGENNVRAKLTKEQVEAIRRALLSGVRCSELAKQYPVSRMQISRIKRGQRWKDAG